MRPMRLSNAQKIQVLDYIIATCVRSLSHYQLMQICPLKIYKASVVRGNN
jgi:hypothetical protein